MDKSAKLILLERQEAQLQTACIENLPKSDPSRANLVSMHPPKGDEGRYQIRIQPIGHHPDDENWKDGLEGAENDLGMSIPGNGKGQLGAKRFQCRRGTVLIRVNLNSGTSRVSDEQREQVQSTLIARVESTIQQAQNLKGFVDDFGEHVHYFTAVRTRGFDLVSERNEAFIDWAALTTLPRRSS